MGQWQYFSACGMGSLDAVVFLYADVLTVAYYVFCLYNTIRKTNTFSNKLNKDANPIQGKGGKL